MSSRLYLWCAALGALVLVPAGCKDVVADRVLHRSACLVCHQPLNEEGTPHGIASAHENLELGCTSCHGGQAFTCDGTLVPGTGGADPTCEGSWVYTMEAAHVQPGADDPRYIKNLSSEELDSLDRDYLRFINPGDLRVAAETCGVCHPGKVEAVERSTMAHTSGEVTVARWRAGAQDDPHGIYGAVGVVDPNSAEGGPCAVAELLPMEPDPLPAVGAGTPLADIPTVAEAQDQYMVKSCFRCHLNDFGENRFPGDFRSSGCTACHMPYANDGLYQGTDPWISRNSVPHPVRHQLTAAPPIEACTHCHYRGGRLGIGFQGYRESAGPGLNPDNKGVLGLALHGHDANYYLTDEDTTNDWDETPPDLHFEAGMHCVDCHTEVDIHGDGHIYADTQCAVQTECTDCHGTVRQAATLDPQRNNMFERNGELWLKTKVTNIELRVPQTIDAITPGNSDYNAAAHQAMGVNADGFSHTDTMECHTCHAGWIPTCYGCHVDLDLGQSKPYHTTGIDAPGKPAGKRDWVTLNDLVLLRNSEGLLAPSMPAERFFMTLTGVDGTTLYEDKPRTFTFPDGRKIAGFGQRAFNPHTTRRKSQFMACDRCHSAGSVEAPTNEVLLDLTHGFGTDRFMMPGCDVTNEDDSCGPDDQTTYRMDAVQTRAGEPLVAIGHPDPEESRVLTLDEIARMRAILVPADAPLSTVVPVNATTDPWWPKPIRFSDQVYVDGE